MIGRSQVYRSPWMAFSGEWADLLGSVEDAQGLAALTREQYGDGTHNSGFLMRYFHNNQNDEIQLTFQLNHDVKIAGEARFHLHLIPMALPVVDVSDIVRWTYYYHLNPIGSALPRNIASWTTDTLTHQIAPVQRFVEVVKHIVTVPIPDGTPSSSMLRVRIIRPANTDAADTYSVNKDVLGGGLTAAANLAVTGIDIHVQRSQAGSIGEY